MDFMETKDNKHFERIIQKRYGTLGMQVYSLIDGKKTAEEIMRKLNMVESKFLEILAFMEQSGIIMLNYPGIKNPNLGYPKESVDISLPDELKQRMTKRDLNWNEIAAKLFTLYLDSLERVEKETSSKSAQKSSKTKVETSGKPKKTSKKTLAKPRKTAKKSSKKK